MWIFLILFFLASTIYTVLNISLSGTQEILRFSILVLVVIMGMFFPFTLSVTKDTLDELIKNESIVSLIAVIQVFESILFSFISILLIKGHYFLRIRRVITWLTVIPSTVFLIGLFFLQSYSLIYTVNISYWLLGLSFSLGVGVLIFLLVYLVKKVFKDWAIRAELKMLVCFFQLLLAMFLPLVLKGVKVPFSNLIVDQESIIKTIAIVFFIGGLGFVRYYIKENKQVK